ncbi:hypothetical protein [Formosa sp. PL04]|uniref:hypothetical protein n=1 Tax=Formosa sp. PL04 TaxID=3081755 RepID=UPI002980C3F0|nr:hypothetical protein [Formosa sp. PL04]MDW5288270.1 hypothetical protein [Formosa sp. PL04]
MKIFLLVLTLILLTSMNLAAQKGFTFTTSKSQNEYKLDSRPQIEKEHDPEKAKNIELIDLIEILEFKGIQINKFKLGEFVKSYKLYVIADEFLDGKMISSDTILNTSNTYTHFESETPFYDYIDQITVITEDIPEENKSKLSIKTYSVSMSTILEMKHTKKENYLNWRKYVDTKWALNKKIPLLIYASSWRDETFGISRFCGVNYLKENEEGTNELLNYSPNYVKISYVVSD